MINVSKTFLPPQREFQEVLRTAWNDGWITNRGKLVLELEEKLKKLLGITNIIATTNGTLPLQIAIKVLRLTGEIITSPFSYVATTSSIVWEGCEPVFVDIDREYLTIDPKKIEGAITAKTSAILAPHVFGIPCDTEAIAQIAEKYDLKVIYDAAHCFGVRYKGESIFNYGDISTCSFHATKLFHTGEGGAIFANSDNLHNQSFQAHNFGHKGYEEFEGIGINAKMSEFQAAMGISLLPYMKRIVAERKQVTEFYDSSLQSEKTQRIKVRPETDWNFSYYPVIFESDLQTTKMKKALNEENIFPRRYFFPSLNKLPYLSPQKVPVGESVSNRILCLPLYAGLTNEELEKITTIIKKNL